MTTSEDRIRECEALEDVVIAARDLSDNFSKNLTPYIQELDFRLDVLDEVREADDADE